MKRRFILSLLFFLSFVISAFSQVISEDGYFEVAYADGCAPFTVNVKLLKPSINIITYNDEYDPDRLGNEQILSHTYTQPGSYVIKVDPSTGGGYADHLKITVYPSPEPAFQLFTCEDKKIEMKIAVNSPYKMFYIDFGDGKIINTLKDTSHTYLSNDTLTVKGLFDPSLPASAPPNLSCGVVKKEIIPIDILKKADLTKTEILESNGAKELKVSYEAQEGGTYKIEYLTNNEGSFIAGGYSNDNSSYSLSRLDLQNNFYCLRAISYDQCATKKDVYVSDTLCSIGLNGSAINGRNILDWKTHNYQAFKLYRNGAEVLAGSSKIYNDSLIYCLHSYCYQVASISGESVSGKVCLTAQSTPQTSVPIQNVNLSIENESLLLNLFAPDCVSIQSFHIENPNYSFNTLRSDTVIALKDPSCFKINYTDQCGYKPSAKEVCPVWLSSTQNEENYLEWSPFNGWAQGVEYYLVEFLDDENNIILTERISGENNFTDDTNLEDRQIKRYRIKAVPTDKSYQPVYSNIVEINNSSSLHLPNSFTPNGDGLNDTFSPKGKFIKKYKLQVYNEWGELVFVSNEKQREWDGASRGKECPEGTYAYKITVFDYLENTFEQQGLILLLRK